MTRREQRIAVFVLALFLPAVAAVMWGAQLGRTIDRPGALRAFQSAGQDHAAIVFQGAVHLLDAQGQPLSRQPIAALGLGEEPTDLDITSAPDGRLQAWLFDDSLPRLVRCDIAGAPLKLRDCAQVLAGPSLKVDPASKAVHIAVDAARDRVFVAAAGSHRVRALSLTGESLSDSPVGRLFFPNRLRIVGDELVVADNDHRRLAWLGIAQERPGFELRRSLALRDHPAPRAGHKAADFAFMAGETGAPAGLWALAVAQGQKQGAVLLYGPGGAPQGLADLGGHADPLIVDRLGRDLLAADFDAIAWYRIGPDGRYLGEFGAGSFRAAVLAGRERVASARLWTRGGWAGMVLAMVIGFALAFKYSEKPGAAQARAAFASWAGTAAEAPQEPLDLQPAAWFRRQMLLGMGLPLVLLLAAATLVPLLWPQQIPPRLLASGRFLPMAAVALLVVAMIIGAARAVWKASRRALRLHGDRVVVHDGGRPLVDVALGDVLASPQALLIGHHTLAYRGVGWRGQPARWIFDEARLTRHLLARLGPHQLRAQPELARAGFRRLPPWQIAWLAVPFLAWLGFVAWRWLR